ncbi:MAG: RsmB/NOP family class I SAM-dependent RNA methyltransferase [Polyangiaceae bacterium]|nr:RsmB/NOP family class I SAM-dependent RNA methyltransferase [Polyangiaceae bacterium]
MSATAPAARGDGRAVAARVLVRVERDAAFAAAALDAELARAATLAPVERALATTLVYGALRARGALIARLSTLAPRGLPRDELTRAHLLLAAHQLLLLDRIPAHAAVDVAVSALRRERGARVAGFANAVLRKLAAHPKIDERAAVLESAPAWLREQLVAVAGEAGAAALLGAGEAPAVGLRLSRGRSLPEWLAAAEPGRVAPRARRVRREGDPRKLAGHAAGDFSVQEEGAQVVGLLVGARPGERVLDACAGRGGKAALLAEAVGPGGEVWATDVHPSKLDALRAELERLGLQPAQTRAVDWTVGAADVPRGFDRVLVDAPCSGTGTLRRRPEIAHRLGPDDPERLAELSARILRAAATRARPGGRVTFAVCSVLPVEGEEVVARVADVLEPAPFDAPELLPLVAGGATHLRLLPHVHGTDGYFVASFVARPDTSP